MRLSTAFFFLAVVVASPVAPPAVICADTSGEITQALITAANDGVDTDIRIVSGTYVAPIGGWQFLSGAADQFKKLKITGGWQPNDNCSTQLYDSTLTKLSGGDLRRILFIQRGVGNTATLEISRLTLTHAFSSSGNDFENIGVAMWIDGEGHTGPMLVEHLIARDNASLNGRATVYIGHKGELRFRNNLVVGNEGGGGTMGASINALGNAYVTNNTVADNVVLSSPYMVTGLNVVPNVGANAYVANNVVWGNAFGAQSADLQISSAMLLVANDIEHPVGTPSGGSISPTALPPQFVGGGDYRLAPASPLHDLGVDAPIGGQSVVDLAGEIRKLGAGTDLGAFETAFVPGPAQPDAVFKNGFE